MLYDYWVSMIEHKINKNLHSNIESAQSIRGVPSSEIMVPYPSIRSLLNSQVQRYGDQTFLCIRDNGNYRKISFNTFLEQVYRCANFLRREKVKFGDRVSVTYKEEYRSLIQVFGIWEVGGTVYLDEVKSVFPMETHLFDDALKEESPTTKIGKKSKLADECLIVRNNEGRHVILSHYNLIVNGMAIAERFHFNDHDILGCTEPISDVLNLTGTVMTALYTGCRVNLGNFQSVRGLFSYSNSRSIKAKTLIKPHTSFKEKFGISGFFMPELTGFASFQSEDGKLFDGMIPIGTPLHICEMAVIDHEGNSLKIGDYGELGVRGHNVMKGYAADHEANRAVFSHGWFHTGWTAVSQKNSNGNKLYFVMPQ